MKALIYDSDYGLRLVEKPEPRAAPGSAVMRVNASAICGTDMRTYRYGSEKIPSGTTLGHEGVGEIVAVGPEVSGFGVGDRVQIAPAIDPVEDYAFQIGRPNMSPRLQTIGFQFDGMFAEYMEIPEAAFKAGNVNSIQESVSDEEAVLTEPIACVLNGQEYLNIGEGDRIAVFGSGFIGCMHAELAFLSGAHAVYMIEPNQLRLNRAVELNARIIPVNPSKADPVEAVLEYTNGDGAQAVITACSVGPAHTQALEMAAVCGRISLFGGLPGESRGFLDSNLIHYKELSVHGVHASTPAQNRTVLEWLAEERLDAKRFISRLFSPNEIMDAFTLLAEGSITKAVMLHAGEKAPAGDRFL